MADNTLNTREQCPEPEASADPEPASLSTALDLALFTPEEVARLDILRQRVNAGWMGELTQDYKRLMFARWLLQHGMIDD